jgi:hypothetical protein
MQKKYGNDGLVAISVSLDDPAEKDVKEKVTKILQKQKAAFENFILDEKPEAWQKQFEIEGPPCIFVFNREGKYQKFNTGEKYDTIEKVVVQFLKK